MATPKKIGRPKKKGRPIKTTKKFLKEYLKILKKNDGAIHKTNKETKVSYWAIKCARDKNKWFRKAFYDIVESSEESEDDYLYSKLKTEKKKLSNRNQQEKEIQTNRERETRSIKDSTRLSREETETKRCQDGKERRQSR